MTKRTELVQRRGLLKRTYSLEKAGIRVSERSPSFGRTLTVPYDIVYGERIELMTASKTAFWAAIVMAILSILVLFRRDAETYAWLFWAIFAAVAALYYWASRREQVGFVDGDSVLLFLRDKPSAAAVEEFVVEVRKRARELVRERVLPLTASNNPRADLERAAWLHDKAIITVDEFVEFEWTVKSGGSTNRAPN